jgi:non-specific serine/threonine protein kinase
MGETMYQVPTLSLPKPQRLLLTDPLIEYEGIRLFVERASAVNADFALADQNAGAVLQICQQLDGIPLALELAAARTKLLTVEHISERLNDRFNLLTQGSRTALPRQQTLRATIDWSYDLLSEEARLLFRRLSIFAGGFTLEAAEQICSEKPLTPRTVLDLLTRLVDRSLVKVERQGEYERYRLLEMLGEYAREKLDESGEKEPLRQRHRDFFIALAEQAEPKLKSAEQVEWLDRLEVEFNNLRVAWDWAIETDTELALRLVSALLDFWLMRGNPGEGRKWLANLLPRTVQWGKNVRRAHALNVAGQLAYAQRDFAVARLLFEEALPIARISREDKEIALVLLGLGRTAHRQHDNQEAYVFAIECLMIYQELRDPW